LKSLNNGGKTVVIVTHDKELSAMTKEIVDLSH
jgi:ABC-type lipoprotein export system ATPase subunit